MSVNEKMTAIANAVRGKTGGVARLTLDEIADAIEALEVGGGGDIEALLSGDITEFSSDTLATIREHSFSYCASLVSVEIPLLTSVPRSAFSYCTSLKSINFPNATTVGPLAFSNCTTLETVTLASVGSIGTTAFSDCSGLKSLCLPGSTVCVLESTSALIRSGIASNKGYIYVPSSLVDTYKAATNWSTYASRIMAIT